MEQMVKIRKEKMTEELDLKEGTVEFWVRKGKLQWNDGLIQVLFNMSNEKGSIFMLKDSDNKLKFFHVLLGKGRTDVEVDVSDLSASEAHHIAATWSVNNKETVLYIDGGKKTAKSRVEY